MKILIGIGVVAVVLVLLAAFGIFDIGETLGLTANCATPFCGNSSRMFGDFCSPCQEVIDGVSNFLNNLW